MSLTVTHYTQNTVDHVGSPPPHSGKCQLRTLNEFEYVIDPFWEWRDR